MFNGNIAQVAYRAASVHAQNPAEEQPELQLVTSNEGLTIEDSRQSPLSPMYFQLSNNIPVLSPRRGRWLEVNTVGSYSSEPIKCYALRLCQSP